ncbi:MAG: hypothetical protein Ct9H90mP1_0800 [Methanobacteriota archaeon]|nr:MAG: hypothetical protein Ct9H90mP1_0800 [Euryarchaeota archaeon]
MTMEVGVSLQRAIELTSQLTLVREDETIPLITASGRTLFEDLRSMVDDPRFDNSAMDGWAVREAGLQGSRSHTEDSGNQPGGL